jgi:peptidoglycan/xylan/chitin deacetylase (PgdA/CDA1 family)
MHRSFSQISIFAILLGLALPLTGQSLTVSLPATTEVQPAPTPPPALAPSVIILDYHTFLDAHDSGIDFSLDEFASQLDAMKALGYSFVTMEDAIAGRIEGWANIVITIDDGNHSIYQACKTVLESRGIKPVLFVYPAIILGHVSYAITQARLAELVADGETVGAHGYHHNPLTDKAWDKDPKDFMVEIKKAGPGIAKVLGSAPTLFAYPFGVYSKRAEEELVKAGYLWAFAADDKVRRVNFLDPALDHMAVPRTIVYRWNRLLVLDKLKRLQEHSN